MNELSGQFRQIGSLFYSLDTIKLNATIKTLIQIIGAIRLQPVQNTFENNTPVKAILHRFFYLTPQ